MSLQDHDQKWYLFNFGVHVILTWHMPFHPQGYEDISSKHWTNAKQIVTQCWNSVAEDVHV